MKQERSVTDWTATLVLALLVAGAMAGCSSRGNAQPDDGEQATEQPAERPGNEGDADAPDEPEKIPVEVVTLGRGPIEQTIRSSANIEAESSVEVYGKTTGIVEELAVEEGDRVREGALLARLEDAEQKNQVAQVEAELARARREYERQKRLHADQLISDQAFNDATFEVRQLELRLDDARRQLEYTRIRAPIAGTVTARYVNRGELVRPNQHLFDIVDFDSLVARIYVPERDLPRLVVGQTARVVAPALGERTWRGRVIRIAPTVDPKSGTVKVTIGLGGQSGLRPGLFVSVTLVVGTDPRALLIPKRALVWDGEQAFVYRIDPDELTAERIPVTPQMESREFVTPGDGRLTEGDLLVVAGQAGLDDGAPVEILSPEDEADEAADRQEAPVETGAKAGSPE